MTTSARLDERILILLPYPKPTHLLTPLRARFPSSTITYQQTTDIRPSSATSNPLPSTDSTILFTQFHFPTPSDPTPHYIHLFSSGLDLAATHPLFSPDSPTVFTNSTGVHGPQIAEHVFGTLLSLTHHLPFYRGLQQKHIWAPREVQKTVTDLAGRTLGVLGYGSIGRQVGNVARALGMRVHAYTRGEKVGGARRDEGYVVPGTGDREGVVPERWFSEEKEGLAAFLGSGLDVLVLAVPLTGNTKFLIGKEELEVLVRGREGREGGAYVVNIARGGVLDQEALLERIRDPQGGVEGAALDVVVPEPLGEDSGLWGEEKVLLTPHTSGLTTRYLERSMEIFAGNLERLEKGEPLVNVAEKGRGY